MEYIDTESSFNQRFICTGSGVHDEVTSKAFCEMLRDLVKTTQHDNLRAKILELTQAWAFAFRNSPKYRSVQVIILFLTSCWFRIQPQDLGGGGKPHVPLPPPRRCVVQEIYQFENFEVLLNYASPRGEGGIICKGKHNQILVIPKFLRLDSKPNP